MSHQESLSQLFPEHELPSPFSQSPKEAQRDTRCLQAVPLKARTPVSRLGLQTRVCSWGRRGAEKTSRAPTQTHYLESF